MKKGFLRIVCLLFCLVLTVMIVETPAQAKSATLNKKVYKRVKGWWTTNSSGGYFVKISKTKMKYYKKDGKKVVMTAKIKGCKKVKGGYLIQVKVGKWGKWSYFMYNKKYKDADSEDILEFHGGWKKKGNNYSGSSSLMKGKWKGHLLF